MVIQLRANELEVMRSLILLTSVNTRGNYARNIFSLPNIIVYFPYATVKQAPL